MKIQELPRKINAHDELVVCFDVGKDALEGYALHLRQGAPDRQITLSIERKTDQIEDKLNELVDHADEQRLKGLCVVCEPTGGYDQELLRLAPLNGHRTAYVNTEHGSKMSVIDSGDTNKTDQADTSASDARALLLVAEVDRTQAARPLEGEHGLLRQLGQMYEEEDEHVVKPRFHHVLKQLFCDYEKRADFLFDRLTRYYDEDEETLTAARQRIQAVISDLFPDYDKSATFTFDTTGQAPMDAYAFNPYHIQRAGLGRFNSTMKRRVNARFSTLEHLFERAEESARYHKTEAEVHLLVDRLKALWADYKRLSARRKALRSQIEVIGTRLVADGELPELSHLKGITLSNITRLAGQTGPLTDFGSGRALLRYAGLNLRERQSGTYRGQT